MNDTKHYKGRFAPSATGPLHLGSLVTSLACALETHSRKGTWFVRIDDIKQAPQSQIIEDLVLFRREGYYSYHLSCVTNDHADGVTHIIRGADLIDAEQPQRQLITALHFTQPNYSYIPLVRNLQGQKLSKQNYAPAINIQDTTATLIRALAHFNWPETLPTDHLSTLDSLWDWALHYWDLSLNLWSNS